MSKGKRVAVIYYFETLPTRLAPVLILDAYGHDRMFYKLWHDPAEESQVPEAGSEEIQRTYLPSCSHPGR